MPKLKLHPSIWVALFLLLSFVVELSKPSGHILYVSIKEAGELKPGGLDDCFVLGPRHLSWGSTTCCVCIVEEQELRKASFDWTAPVGTWTEGEEGDGGVRGDVQV